ncbi:hypothetical protein PAXRUDRAFT_19263 [Paxillus rubicundulus Ve08.2h10]|uniref:Uncharacterized protein n=1 Tax=Paxillus rubicundulus Ve08.2h10 TaxID=930991 RepID=A0A0D0DCM4_9AGAM|nr:hypothetical protein PAXRUDRAFT_19263 [Paxillus rubicundulus Ve08.2h10]
MPNLPNLVHCFLFNQIDTDNPCDPSEIPPAHFPYFEGHISIFNSASSCFYAPSDLSGSTAYLLEQIQIIQRKWG